MKKIFFLLAAMMVMFTIVPSVHAEYVIGAAIPLESISDGMEVAIEARSAVGNRGTYLPYYNYKKSIQDVSKCVPYKAGDEIPMAIIWKLVKADDQNEKTGAEQYYLLNKETNTYLSITWIPNGDWPQSTQTMVEDKDKATKFCFNYSMVGGDYGSVDYGNAVVDWKEDGSAVTIAEIGDAVPNGRGFLVNQFASDLASGEVNFRAFYLWQDSNVWTLHRYLDLSDSREKLLDLIDQLPAEIEDDYLYGTEPGYLADQAKYTDFIETLMKVIDDVDKMTPDECEAAYQKLNELRKYIEDDANIVPIEAGGYYYIFTAYDAFWKNDNGNYAMYGPHDNVSDIIGWKAFNENDPKFIWQVDTISTKNGLRYKVKNAATGVYFNKARVKEDGQQILWSSEFDTPTIFRPRNHAGQWMISDDADQAYPPRPFHMEGHAGGGGTSGMVVLWDGGKNTASSWFVKKVPQEQVDKLANIQGYINLNKTFALNRGLVNRTYEIKDAPGYITSQELIDNYKAVEADVDTMLNHSEGKTYTDAEYAAAGEKLVAAAEAFKANRDRGLSDGYYRIQLNHWFALKNDNNYYVGIVDGKPGWKRAPEATVEQIWKVTNLGNGKYSLQNMANGKYFGKALSQGNGSPLQFSDTPDVPQGITPFPEMIGQFYFTNGVDSTYHYDDWGHNEGTAMSYPLCYYGGKDLYGGTAWAFVPVSDADFETIKANDAKQMLEYELIEAATKARGIYNRNTVYKHGDAIITSADQLYSNNSSINEGQHLEYLLDENVDTYWNSAWDTETENATHYLRYMTNDPAGLPDSILLYTVSRNSTSWHRVPSKYRVSVSNDAETWTALPTLLVKSDMGYEDLAAFNMTPQYIVVNGVKGYKYVKFDFLAVQPNAITNHHPFADFSEVNLYPITGIDAEQSESEAPENKSFFAALYNALQTAQKEIDAHAPTQATVDALNTALENYNFKGIADSAIVAAKLNVENFTAGEAVGEFDADALDKYTEAAKKVLNELEDNENMSAAEYTKAGTDLIAAYNELLPSMVKPVAGKWYIIAQCDEAAGREGKVMNAGGPHGHTDSRSTYSYWLDKNTIDMSSVTDYNHFVFKAQEDGTFILQNVGSGFYNGPETGSGNATYDYRPIQWHKPNPVNIVPLGGGQVGFSIKSGRFIRGTASWYADGMTYDKRSADQAKNTAFAWKLIPSTDEVSEVTSETSVAHGRVIAITRSYELNGLPRTADGYLRGYKIVGAETAENSADSIITAYKLQQYAEDEIIPAGTPVIYISHDDYNPDESVDVTFYGHIDGGVTSVGDTVNGLKPVIDQYWTAEEHYGYFLADSVVDEPQNTQIGQQRAVIIPYLVKNIEGAQVDKIVYVRGAGMLNGINEVVVEDAKELVNVYSVDGVLVRRNVARINATRGLAKGIYIVGKQKVLVK